MARSLGSTPRWWRAWSPAARPGSPWSPTAELISRPRRGDPPDFHAGYTPPPSPHRGGGGFLGALLSPSLCIVCPTPYQGRVEGRVRRAIHGRGLETASPRSH